MSQIKNLVKLALLEYVNTQKKYNSFPLNSLVKFAKKFDDFKQFSKWYYIHITKLRNKNENLKNLFTDTDIYYN